MRCYAKFIRAGVFCIYVLVDENAMQNWLHTAMLYMYHNCCRLELWFSLVESPKPQAFFMELWHPVLAVRFGCFFFMQRATHSLHFSDLIILQQQLVKKDSDFVCGSCDTTLSTAVLITECHNSHLPWNDSLLFSEWITTILRWWSEMIYI